MYGICDHSVAWVPAIPKEGLENARAPCCWRTPKGSNTPELRNLPESYSESRKRLKYVHDLRGVELPGPQGSKWLYGTEVGPEVRIQELLQGPGIYHTVYSHVGLSTPTWLRNLILRSWPFQRGAWFVYELRSVCLLDQKKTWILHKGISRDHDRVPTPLSDHL